ncbi:GntR family transcriptional regulator [Streptomyces sp. NPDC056161]|uniref:GntR family transcriptional regulator n=1 Tax=Streptomyces sp. NPDC056161 TaxID=3345732 RepID=UPI0035D7C5DD
MTTDTTPSAHDSLGMSEHLPSHRELRGGRSALTRLVNTFESRPEQPDDRQAVHRFIACWLPAAETRLRGAVTSLAAQERWHDLIAAVQPVGDGAAEPPLLELCASIGRLLRALDEASRPGPGVEEIARRMRRSITTGVYPPGASLSAGRIAAENGCGPASASRIVLAARDLEAEGLVTIGTGGQIRVAGATLSDRGVQAAEWIKALIQAGVYPPNTALPTQGVMARALAIPAPVLVNALHLLHDEGVVFVQRGTRAVVRGQLPFPVAEAPDPDGLLPRLGVKALPDADTSYSGIRETCRRAHAWWNTRTIPHPDTLRHTHRALTAVVAYLLPLAARRHPQVPGTHVVLQRAAITALAVLPGESSGRLWRTACLAASCLELLDLAGDAV